MVTVVVVVMLTLMVERKNSIACGDYVCTSDGWRAVGWTRLWEIQASPFTSRLTVLPIVAEGDSGGAHQVVGAETVIVKDFDPQRQEC